MKLGDIVRRSLPALVGFAGVALTASVAFATLTPNSAKIIPFRFQDCPISTFTPINAFPALIEFDDNGTICPSGFANLHLWSYSEDGGATEAIFNNDDSFKMSAILTITGSKESEAGLRLSPWWTNTDGRFNCRTTDGEVAVFGGRLPFYNFTASQGVVYVKGNPIYLEMTYTPNLLTAASPGTIEYRLVYNGSLKTSGILAFDMGNPAEDPPHGLWGILNGGTGGGYLASFIAGGAPGNHHAKWEDMKFLKFDPVPASNTTWGKVKDSYR